MQHWSTSSSSRKHTTGGGGSAKLFAGGGSSVAPAHELTTATSLLSYCGSSTGYSVSKSKGTHLRLESALLKKKPLVRRSYLLHLALLLAHSLQETRYSCGAAVVRAPVGTA